MNIKKMMAVFFALQLIATGCNYDASIQVSGPDRYALEHQQSVSLSAGSRDLASGGGVSPDSDVNSDEPENSEDQEMPIATSGACGENAHSNKVEICHVPPGNPLAAHTICISKNALGGHGLDPERVKNHVMHSDDYLGKCGGSGGSSGSTSGGSPDPSPSPSPIPDSNNA